MRMLNHGNVSPVPFWPTVTMVFNFLGSSEMDQNQLYDIQTIEVMRRVLVHDSNAIDVGCHAGSVLSEILKIAPDGQHFAFEPLPDMFANLQRDFSTNHHVSLHNLALSDNSGSVTFQHVVTNPGYSGLRKRHYERDNEQVVEIHVQTARLDDIIPKDVDIRFIKIDVEGAELGVLRGAVDTIRRCRPVIVFEHGLGAADYYGTTPEDVFDLLVLVCGLRCFTMEHWLANAGNKHLERTAFCEEFRSGRDYYFLAA
jgi:FkbM family methyltransferase